MSYYMGDFYGSGGFRTRAMQGDPGFFSVLGKFAKKAIGFIPGVGPAASAALDMLPTASKGGIAKSAMKKVLEVGKTTIIKHPVMTGAAAAGAVAAGGMVAGSSIQKHRDAARMLGHRKHRRMNPCNVRALRRASRRAHAFLKLSSKLVRYYAPHKKKGRAYIKHRKRAA